MPTTLQTLMMHLTLLFVLVAQASAQTSNLTPYFVDAISTCDEAPLDSILLPANAILFAGFNASGTRVFPCNNGQVRPAEDMQVDITDSPQGWLGTLRSNGSISVWEIYSDGGLNFTATFDNDDSSNGRAVYQEQPSTNDLSWSRVATDSLTANFPIPSIAYFLRTDTSGGGTPPSCTGTTPVTVPFNATYKLYFCPPSARVPAPAAGPISTAPISILPTYIAPAPLVSSPPPPIIMAPAPAPAPIVAPTTAQVLEMRFDWKATTCNNATAANITCPDPTLRLFTASTMKLLTGNGTDLTGPMCIITSGEAFQEAAIPGATLDVMKCVFKADNGTDIDFWSNAWEKTGKCSGFKMSEYFATFMNGYTEYGSKLNEILFKNTLGPPRIDAALLKDAIIAEYGHQPLIDCAEGQITYVSLCMDPDFKELVDCPVNLQKPECMSTNLVMLDGERNLPPECYPFSPYTWMGTAAMGSATGSMQMFSLFGATLLAVVVGGVVAMI